MDRKQVERFLAVLEHGSMTAAAKALYLKQASISSSIRELETQLGAELFHRGGRDLELTEAGRALVDPALQILRSFDEAKVAVDDVTIAGPSGKLFIGCSAALVTAPAIDLIAEFCRRYPRVEVRCEEVPPGQEAFELLKRGRLELMFHNEIPRRDLHRVQYTTEPLCAVLPPGSEIGPGAVSLGDLAPFGLIASHSMAQSNVRQAGAEVSSGKIDYRLPAVVEDRRMVVGLVMRGIGATIFPESVAQDMEKQGAVIRPMAWPEREAWVYHREGHLSTAANRFLELVVALQDKDPAPS